MVLFADHADPDRFYVVPEVPRISLRDDGPAIDLTLFRGDLEGALLRFEVALRPTDEELHAVETAFAAAGRRRPDLRRPDWRDGTFRLAGWLAADELAPTVLHTGRPSLAGHPGALVAARLDRHGAALADGSLRGDALPVVAMFELETVGLAGPISVQAEADLHAIHRRLTVEGALTTPIAAASIEATWERFLRENLVRIDVLDESGDPEAARAEALRRVGQDLVLRMLTPEPPPELPPQLEDGSIAPIELSFRLTARQEELATFARWDFRERSAVPIRHHAAASLIGLVPEGDGASRIREVDLDTLPRSILLRTEPDLEALGLEAVEIDLRWPDGPEVGETLVLTPEAMEATVHLPIDPDMPGVEARARARFDPEATSAEDRETDWFPAEGRFLLLSPGRLFPTRSVAVLVGRGEMDWIDHVELEATVGDGPTHSALLDRETLSATLHLPGAGEEEVRIVSHWQGMADEPARSTASRTVEGELLVLDSPFGPSIPVLVVPRPLDAVAGMGVECELEHGDLTDRKEAWWEPGDHEPRSLALRRLADAPALYRYRTTVLESDGTLHASDWREKDGDERWAIIVGGDDAVDVIRRTVVVLGGGPAARGSLAMELVLRSGDHETRTILEGDADTTELLLVAPEGSPAPMLVVTEHMNDGTVRTSEFDDDGTLFVIPPPATD